MAETKLEVNRPAMPPVGFVDMLDMAILKKVDEEQAAPPKFNPLRPSSAGKCTRELGYGYAEFKGYAKYPKEPMGADTYRLLNLGHSIEYHLLKLFQDLCGEYFQIKYKQQMLTFYPISAEQLLEGSLDAVFISDKWKCLMDVKSKGDKYSSYFSNRWEEMTDKLKNMRTVETVTDKCFYVQDLVAFLKELDDPFFASNFLQINGYLLTDFVKERGINFGAVVQYNKNDSKTREVRFAPSPELHEAVKSKFQTVAKVVEETKSPETLPRDYTLGTIKCAFCDFRKTCWPEGDALKAYFATWPKRQWPERITDPTIVNIYTEYRAADKAGELLETLELSLIRELVAIQVDKAEFPDGAVFEVRHMKSPKPHLALRRSKK